MVKKVSLYLKILLPCTRIFMLTSVFTMRRNLLKVPVFVALAGLLLASCGGKKSDKNTSSATGWKINAKEGGFQYNTDFKDQETGPGLVLIEGGTFTMGQVQDNVMHDWDNMPTQQHVQSFYMDETEVTNKMYMEYLDWLKRVFPPDQEQYRNIYIGALPDTLVWRSPLSANEAMVTNYLRHPAYAEYPVVGVNWVQAVQFSTWRTDRVNEAILERDGFLAKDARYNVDAQSTFSTDTYLNAPSETYGGKIQGEMGGKKATDKNGETAYAKQTSGILLPEYRLPTEAEWEYAAKSLNGIREYNSLQGRKKYPWDSQYTRSTKRRTRGDQLANFKQGKGDYGGLAGWSDDKGDITVAVKTYPPNDFGLYDMAGNVAEWVADVYRPIIDDEISDFNYYRGNVYMKHAIDKDGKQVVVTTENVKYDTLPNGKIIARNLPGNLATIPIDSSETYLRYNFTHSDNRSYHDGDKASTRNYRGQDEMMTADADYVNSMYNAPKPKKQGTSPNGKDYDTSNDRTSLIDDEVRVYKGGSWRDRAYWIDPAQRRYLPQYIATDYIGFRNAMSRVGSKAKKNHKTPKG
ncbi:protein involved in gliding motility GldJ [Capnocytophaga haemolytica]|uniref:Gliding motility-associated lipoprotein GldJ n=2 Tax=Capnocytophaga haemolytica TaxID=45243 RepID=A0AAX2GXV8_9FLAO|nr:protein involved in gliding motility GldJ [Capnocytophaga haemolytica]SNV10325.1 gliding motility-associated lipoprotein GldJ [Capnocytophaga haemolytica]